MSESIELSSDESVEGLLQPMDTLDINESHSDLINNESDANVSSVRSNGNSGSVADQIDKRIDEFGEDSDEEVNDNWL